METNIAQLRIPEQSYLDGKVKLCDEHKRYFWAAIKSLKRLNFTRNFLKNLNFA